MKSVVVNSFLISIFIGWLSVSAFCQKKQATKQSEQYVKIEVGHHILRCPVLPSCLKPKLMELKGIRNYILDEPTSCITFSISRGAITSEQIVSMAVSCAFPEADVKVLMADKPFGK